MADDNESSRESRELSAQHFPTATLYVVATPIGNLADITLRALECLGLVDAIAAEDTRLTRRLLAHHGIARPCFAVHRHNEREAGAAIVERLRSGERIAYVSDAGTPAISDPGAILVDAVRNAGLRVMPIPGASALTCALSAAGLAGDKKGAKQGAKQAAPFYFHGFLPAKRGEAETILKPLAALAANLVFYEAPHRVRDTAALLVDVFGTDRQLVIARELTKMFEDIHRCSLGEASAWLDADPNNQRGEFVLIVEGQQDKFDLLAEALPMLVRLLEVLPLSEAVDLVSEVTKSSRKALYSKALELKKSKA